MKENSALPEMTNSIPTDIIIDKQNTIEDINENTMIEIISLLKKNNASYEFKSNYSSPSTAGFSVISLLCIKA